MKKIKLNIQLFGGRGATSGSGAKTYRKGDIRYKVTRGKNGLYSYQSQEYSKINKKWVNMSKQSNFTKTALENWLDINIR